MALMNVSHSFSIGPFLMKSSDETKGMLYCIKLDLNGFGMTMTIYQ